ncbi:hypothetical protein [Dietzia psychralcaliphila]|uniref:DUF8176 domain-containing protein n=1 Tax=Dietzia psychralcaliphila TaxID=139021 RepID=A0AAD0JPP5_9ACTN|nr:hypothetical protein [Dietzia psychralcaliphila]AWH94384.1 hypothetical protein A6048_01360 [Dietzia psychralcaliphila]PTM88013.1 hypothetical protein C8N39_104231 [Dietzia psychralcaliphila]
MADQPRTGDDDEATTSEVTVPPWLRTGPTPEPSGPEQSAAVPSAVARSAAGRGGAVPERADAGPQDSSREISPNRIRLGAGERDDEPVGEPGQPGGRGEPGAGESRRRERDLSSLPLDAEQPVSVRSGVAGLGPDRSPTRDGRARRLALFAVAGVAVLAGSAVLGFVIARGALTPTGGEATDCAPVSEPGRVVGDGPGSLATPLETVLAFDYAYYVDRSAEKAFEAVSPSSRMTREQLRADGVDRVPEGTTHCVEALELSPTLLEVSLTESPPDAEPVVMRQRVRVAENPDGTWGIVSITPAG